MNLGRGYQHAGAAPPFSVVIPTHEGSTSWLGDCLQSVLAQDDPTVIELIVVFDGEAPQAQRLVRELAPAARQISLRRKRGFAEAADEGLRLAHGGLVALLNDDARLDPSWLGAMVRAAEEHPDAGSFASRIFRTDEPEILDSAGHGLTRWGEPFAIGAGCPDGPWFDEAREVFGAPATAAVFRRELLLDSGGLDRGMEAYLEDVDLSLRAQCLGFPCMYVPGARAHHLGSSSYGWGPEGSGRAERLVARNRIHVLLKSMPRSALRSAGPAVLASILADLGHRTVTRRHAFSALQGTVDGLVAARHSLAARPTALGGRRVDDAWLREVFRNSEAALVDLGKVEGAGRWRSSRATLCRLLRAWVDHREQRSAPAPF